MEQVQTTIAAVCGGPGGALSIVRLSGPDALTIANRIWKGRKPLSAESRRVMHLGYAVPDPDTPEGVGEPCLAVYMPGPHSYTGEDVAELQCHGGNLAPKRILRAALRAGARNAEPGEFTRRAFINGKMDLTQAEAVADLISAKSESACRLAEHQMSGRLGSEIRAARQPLIHVLAEVESRMDFPEEDLDWMPPKDLLQIMEESRKTLRKLLSSKACGALIRDGLRLVIAGSPNVGKSSLLNHLLGFDRAIVTAIPGTTRDTVEETATIRGIAVNLTDTAGIRRNPELDPVETLGIERSKNSIRSAELVVWMLDASEPEQYAARIEQMLSELPHGVPAIVCWNKVDLLPAGAVLPEIENLPSVRISVTKSVGLEDLADRIEALAWKDADHSESDVAVAERHVFLLEHAEDLLRQAYTEVRRTSWELAASCLHLAVMDLGRVTGENASPDILDEIFARFCIGK